jgi:hypothetical protein
VLGAHQLEDGVGGGAEASGPAFEDDGAAAAGELDPFGAGGPAAEGFVLVDYCYSRGGKSSGEVEGG